MTVYCSDAVLWANEYSGPLHHAMLCDPPYHLTTITKRFGKDGAAPAAEGVYKRSSAGFMNQVWDGGDIAFRAETWVAFAKMLHPGAFGMAFASSRGFHRQAVAIEDAGFILHPFIAWAFGSGFPKATRIKGDLAFEGHRYGLQALKPAVEPILVFQKPYEGRPLDCITRTGAGALNIDAGGGGGGGAAPPPPAPQTMGSKTTSTVYGAINVVGGKQYAEGRWPSNLIVGDPEAAAMIDRQSGTSKSNVRLSSDVDAPGVTWALGRSGVTARGHAEAEASGCSRFFFNVQTQIDCADPVIYRAKAGSTERNAGLELHTVTESADPGALGDGNRVTMPRSNTHPTVKPLSLTRYLASLLLPPASYAPRRLFVPFSGVGSEICGAELAGWEEVSGVEMSTDYCAIAEARLRFWSCNAGLFETVCEQPEPEPQGNLFTDDDEVAA